MLRVKSRKSRRVEIQNIMSQMAITNGDTDLEVDCATFSLIIHSFKDRTDKYLIEHFSNSFFLFLTAPV